MQEDLTARPRVSVCMAAYNGADHIEEQIGSILPQLRDGDELVVVDDCSTDDTARVVSGIGDARIRLVRAPQNRGYVRTFEHALREGRGDVLFLSDQDDVWMPGRVDAMLDALGDDLLVVSNCEHVGAEPGYFHNLRLKPSYSRTHVRNIIGILVGYRLHWGCAMAVRRELLDVALPFPSSMRESHDQYLAMAANVLGRIRYMPEDTILHRLHHQNLTPTTIRSMRRIVRARAAFFLQLAVLVLRAVGPRRPGRRRAAVPPVAEEGRRVAVVISCYQPSMELAERAARWVKDVGPVIAVDDGSPNADPAVWEALRDGGVDVIHLSQNSGIAHALNTGIVSALDRFDPDWILTMDQDSDFGADYVTAAFAAGERAGASARVGMLCSGSQNGYAVPTTSRDQPVPESFDPMQSGTLLRTRMIRDIGLMRADLFIDAVDSEYNARARRHGWRLLAAPGCDLTHSLGEARPMTILGRRLHWFGKPLSIYEHKPFRVYYMTRNNLVLLKAYGIKQPRWVARRLRMEAESHIIRFVFGPQRRTNAVAVAAGLRDGLLNRLGPISPQLRKRL